MLQGLLLSHPALGVEHEQPADEVGQVVTEVLGHLVLQPLDLLRSHLPVLGFEGSPPAVELEGEHSDRPQVQPAVIGGLRDDLGADVVDGAAEGLAGAGSVHGPAEVGELDHVVLAEQYVLGLEIAVDDVQAVQVLHRPDHLAHVARSPPLVEPARLLEVAVELPPGRVLEDDVDPPVVEEEAVHPEDVLVPQVGVDLDLPPQLVDHRLVLDLLLGQHLQSHHHLGLSLARQIHMAIPAWWKKYFPLPMWRPIWKSLMDQSLGLKALRLLGSRGV